MSYAELLLNNDINNEEKREIVNNIIKIYDLPLSAEQILLAFEKTLERLNEINYNANKINRIFLFNKVLDINKNMYIAIILALCDNFNPKNLFTFIIFDAKMPSDIGLRKFTNAIKHYKLLLNYHEFSVCNMPSICDRDKQIIEDHRAEKYSGKLTKCAIKNK